MGDDFNRVKDEVSIRDFAEEYLERSRGGLWCCPVCGSGSHGTASSDGAFSIMPDGRRWRCFSCQESGDIFDLAGIVWHIADGDRIGRLRAVAEWAHIPLEDFKGDTPATSRTAPPATVRRAQEEGARDYTEGRRREAAYIEAMRDNIKRPEALAYLSERGFTLEDAQAAGMGYDPQKKRLILPWRGAEWYHIDRDVTGRAQAKYVKPKSADVGKQPLYNPGAAQEGAYFIVEGVLDAIAVQLCGYEAVAVASNGISEGNVNELVSCLSGRGGGVAVVMLDNDEHGMGGVEGSKLIEALQGAGVPCAAVELSPEYPEDAAAWYQADKEGLRSYLEAQAGKAAQESRERREAAYREALRRFRVVDPADVAADIYLKRGFAEPVETGIRALDTALDGGLRPGLYALGAISSMGKTTLAVQIADHIAAQGRPVLFVTIEQSAQEIVAKSLSRTVAEQTGGRVTISSLEALSASRRELWDEDTAAAFLTACNSYAGRVAPRLEILEGTAQPGTADIAHAAYMMQEHDGQAPAVFIDYLQLLAPINDNDTDKRAIDNNVRALRQLARDMNTPVFVISSLNRASYSEGVTLDSWKESGAIEYGCDVLLGLQPKGIREALDNAKDSRLKRDSEKLMRKHKAGEERDCEIVILKNRNGRTPEEGIPLTFRPLQARYTDAAGTFKESRRII